ARHARHDERELRRGPGPARHRRLHPPVGRLRKRRSRPTAFSTPRRVGVSFIVRPFTRTPTERSESSSGAPTIMRSRRIAPAAGLGLAVTSLAILTLGGGRQPDFGD